MSEQAFANAVAYGQITPGPVTHTVALVGYAAAGLGGALAATAVAFAPSFAMVMLGAPPLRAPARAARNARAFLDGAGPGRGGRDPRRRRPAPASFDTRWQWLVLAAAAVALLARVPPIWVLVARRARGPRHYALSHGARRGAAGRDRRGPVDADPLQDGQSARQRARVPGVAGGLPVRRRARGRARRRRARAPEPGRDATTGARRARRSATSPMSTPCSPTPRTGAPTRGAPSCRDGFLYGRGTIDMKNQTAAEAVAAARLARAGARFNGDAEGDQRRRRGDRRHARRQVDHRAAAGPLARRLPAQRGRGRGHALRRPPALRRLRGREGHVPLQRHARPAPPPTPRSPAWPRTRCSSSRR